MAFLNWQPIGTAKAEELPPPSSPEQARFVLCDQWCALVDGQGKLVINRVFSELMPFEGNDLLAPYRHGEKWGAIDRSGEAVLKPRHDKMRVIARRFLLAEDQAPATQILYDASGRELWRTSGDIDFEAWAGHVYYHKSIYQPDHVRTVFLDDAGQPKASFASFGAVDKEPQQALASLDGKHIGRLGPDLQWLIEPRFRNIENFVQGMAKAYTAQGEGLIDAKGNWLVTPGRYASVFAADGALFSEAFAKGDKNCGVYLKPDGQELVLPPGTCPAGAPRGKNYAYIDDAQRQRRGLIDAQGKLLMAPTWPDIKALDGKHFLVSMDRYGSSAFGVSDQQARLMLPIRSQGKGHNLSDAIQSQAATLFGAVFLGADAAAKSTQQEPYGIGLQGFDGRWRIPPRYAEAQILGANLLWMRDLGTEPNLPHYHLFTGNGQDLGLASHSAPFIQQEAGERFVIFNRPGAEAISGSPVGLFDSHTGQVVISADYKNISWVEDGLWIVSRFESEGGGAGLFDTSGKAVTAFEFLPVNEFDAPKLKHGVAILKDKSYHPQLVNQRGEILASFATLFPGITERNADREELMLDRCLDADPAAEPEDRLARSASEQSICADPALHALSVATEKAWYLSQTGDCLPGELLALRPSYDKALALCSDAHCWDSAMHAFQESIAAAQRRCSARNKQLSMPTWHLSRAQKAQLTKQVSMDGTDPDPGSPERSGINFIPISLGGRRAVIATGFTNAHNAPFEILLTNGKSGWRSILSDYAGYLRPFEVINVLRNGMPVLRTQQHNSCCEHTVTYFSFDKRSYRETQSCTQRYSSDGTPLLSCSPDAWQAPPSPRH